MPRIAGIDLARAIAVFGMFIAHLAVADGRWWWLADGRSSALFALLAGCGLGFITHKVYQVPSQLRQTYPRILTRAALIGILGVALMFLGTPIAIILSSYALMFVLAIPFLGLEPPRLFIYAGVITLLSPPIVQGVRLLLHGAPEPAPIWIPGLFELATGYYPAAVWLAYCLVGLGVIRLPLLQPRVQFWLFLCGVGASAFGYGGGALLSGVLPSGFAQSLVAVEPHTDSGFEVIGNIGVCLIVISLSLFVTQFGWQRLFLSPVLAAGAMPLTLYVAHLFYIRVLGSDAVLAPTSNAPLWWLLSVSIVFAFWWRFFSHRGPLESVLTHLTSTALTHR